MTEEVPFDDGSISAGWLPQAHACYTVDISNCLYQDIDTKTLMHRNNSSQVVARVIWVIAYSAMSSLLRGRKGDREVAMEREK